MNKTVSLEEPSFAQSPSSGQLAWKWLLIFLTVGIIARTVRYLLQFPIWGDESFIALNVLDKDYLTLTEGLRFAQTAPIFFLWVERTALMLFGTSELALRFFPLLAGIGSLLIFAFMVRRQLPAWTATIAVALLAASYFPIRHSSEVKPYSFDLFFTVGLLAIAVAWLSNPQNLRPLWGLCLFVPFAVSGSYPSVFTAGAVSLALLPTVWKHRRLSILSLFSMYNLLMLVTFLANYLIVGKQQYVNQGGASSGCWHMWFVPLEIGPLLKWLVVVHSGDLFSYPIGGPNGGGVPALLLSIVGIFTLWRTGRKSVLALMTLPFALTFLAALVKKYPYGGHARVAQHLAVPICFLMAIGIMALIQRFAQAAQKQHRLVMNTLILLLLLPAGLMMKDIIRPYKTKGDLRCREVSLELAQRATSSEQIVILRPPEWMYPVLEWYVRKHSQPVLWANNLAELQQLTLPDRFWLVQYSTNEQQVLDLSNQLGLKIGQYQRTEELQRPLLLGSVPIAIQHAHYTQWEQVEDKAKTVPVSHEKSVTD